MLAAESEVKAGAGKSPAFAISERGSQFCVRPPRDSERPSNSSITARSLDGSSFQMSRDESPSNAECPSRGKGADQSGGASSAVVSKRPVPPDPAVVRAWVGKTRAAQSLLPVINDPVVIAKLVKLFRLAGDERIPR